GSHPWPGVRPAGTGSPPDRAACGFVPSQPGRRGSRSRGPERAHPWPPRSAVVVVVDVDYYRLLHRVPLTYLQAEPDVGRLLVVGVDRHRLLGRVRHRRLGVTLPGVLVGGVARVGSGHGHLLLPGPPLSTVRGSGCARIRPGEYCEQGRGGHAPGVHACQRATEGATMPIATPEVYAEMLDRAKAGGYAYPAINVTSSQTLNA